MAKKLQKNVRVNRRVRRRRALNSGDDLDGPAQAAAHMLYDPCGSELVPSVYPGDRGYINRFSSNFNAGGAAGETSSVVIFKVGNNVVYNGSAASSTTALTIAYADTQAPGAGFLNPNADKIRATGGCLIIRPLTSPNNSTGQIYYGVIPASTVTQGTPVSAQDLIPLLSQSCTASQALLNPLEVKWSPGTFDDRYCPSTGITGDDDTDRNVIVVVTVGFPAAGGINVRANAIYEWCPRPALGVSIDSTSVAPSKCDISCVLRNLKRKDADWWWQLGRKTLSGMSSVGTAYVTAGAPGAIVALSKFLS